MAHTRETMQRTAIEELIVHTQATYKRRELIGALCALTTGHAAYAKAVQLARLELKYAQETKELVARVQGSRRGDRTDAADTTDA